MTVPSPRNPLLGDRLFRPDWTTGVPRDLSLLWLDKNENTDPDLMALTASILRSIPAEEICTYPECAPLYRKLAGRTGVGANQLLLAAGSDGVIRSVFEAFVNPGDPVVHTSPTFAMYPVYTSMYGAEPVVLRYRASSQGPVLDIKDATMRIRDTKPRVVCLPNPDSPTGTVVGTEQLEAIAVAAGEARAVFLIDEAYYPFYPNSALQLVRNHSHVVIARTFAKAWGMAGLRIGYAITNPEMAAILHKVRPMYEVNTVAVAMVERMLDHEQAMLESVARINAGKDFFTASMKELGCDAFPTHGNFSYAGFGPKRDAVKEAMRGVALFRADSNEECLRGLSRFTATTAPLFRPVVEAIRKTISG